MRPTAVKIRRLALLLALFLATPAAVLRADDSVPDRAEKLISLLQSADAETAPRIVRDLIALGPPALEVVRAARDGAAKSQTIEPRTRRALDRAATWITATKVADVLRRGIETQLTFDGQYASLKRDAKEHVPALFAMIDDESTAFEIRIACCRALADTGDHGAMPQLRNLYNDLLLPPALREEIGVVLAIFGDTHAVRRDLTEYRRFVKSNQRTVRLSAHLQLANLYYRIRDYGEAVKSYEEILRIAEEIFNSRRRAGLPKELMASLRAQITLHYYNAACSNTLDGNIDRAKKYLRKAVKGNPEHFSNIDKDGDLRTLREHESYAAFKKELGKLFEDEEL